MFTNHLTTHCFMQCAVYTFSLHGIHSTVGHMEKEHEGPESAKLAKRPRGHVITSLLQFKRTSM